ncbi:MAG: leucine-rich repeat protein [Prevotella sp.]|nr:leucine-rich repeat protein [Prevotella sp.]
MKRFSIRGLLFVLPLFCSAPAWALDFPAENDDGVTIYYNITSSDDLTVEVTYNGSTDYMKYYSYSGDVTIPETVTYEGATYTVDAIGDHAFYYCTGLTSVEMPSSVTSIGAYAFYYCSALTSITIIDKVTNIESYASGAIGDCAFRNCGALTSVEIPSSVTSIGDQAFYYCKGLTSVEMPSGVTSIGESAFEYAGLISIDIPDGVTNIGEGAFRRCQSLTSVTFGENSQLTSIEDYAFSACYALTSIEIPSGVTSIGDYAFGYDDSLSMVISHSTTAPTCKSYTFRNIASDSWLVVPEDAAENYGSSHRATKATLTGWRTFSHMREETVTVTLTNSEGYVTRYSPYSYELADGLTGVTLTGLTNVLEDGKTFALTTSTISGNHIAAGTATLLYGSGSEGTSYTNYTYNDIDGETTDSGILHGTVESGVTTTLGAHDDDYYFYMLSFNAAQDPSSLGFYWGAENGTPFKAPVDRAWFALAKSNFPDLDTDSGETVSLRILSPFSDESETGFDDSDDADETTTGIGNVSADAGGQVIYNLQGVRVNDMSRKGVYIVNGHKVVKK